MQCEKCSNAEATIHLTEIIKDVKSEVHLCESCAKEIGLNSEISNFTLSIPEMLSFLNLNEIDEIDNTGICLNCGMSYIDYNKSGKLGCPQCYDSFNNSISAIILNYHSSDKHIGKTPCNVKVPVRREIAKEGKQEMVFSNQLTDFKRQLDLAVSDERYEDAAIIRNKIQDIENE